MELDEVIPQNPALQELISHELITTRIMTSQQLYEHITQARGDDITEQSEEDSAEKSQYDITMHSDDETLDDCDSMSVEDISDTLIDAGETCYDRRMYSDALATFCQASNLMLSSEFSEQHIILFENITNTLAVLCALEQPLNNVRLCDVFRYAHKIAKDCDVDKEIDAYNDGRDVYQSVLCNIIVLFWCLGMIKEYDLSSLDDDDDFLLSHTVFRYVRHIIKTVSSWRGYSLLHLVLQSINHCYSRPDTLQLTPSTALSIVRLYVQCGGDVCITNQNGDTPLHIACTIQQTNSDCNMQQIIGLLLCHGARCDVTNSDGYTVMSCPKSQEAQVILNQCLPLSLQCLAARAASKIPGCHRGVLQKYVPNKMVDLVEYHATW